MALSQTSNGLNGPIAEEASKETSGRITPQEMQAAIESSGYLLEGRIGRLLEERGYFVDLNIFHVDPNDGKAIEIDVRGVHPQWINEENKDIAVASVLVECKNNSQPIAFFVQQQQLGELGIGRIYHRGFPSFSMNPDSKVQERLGDLLGMKEWHHYCQAKEIATQFCGFLSVGKKKWRTDVMDRYSKSFSDLALMAALDSQDAFNLSQQCIEVQLAYPVVVFQGPIYRVQDVSGKAVVEEVKQLQLQYFARMNGRTIEAQIDIVTEDAFPALLESISADLAAFKDRINSLYSRLLNSALDQKRVALQNSARQMLSEGRTPGNTQSLYTW